MLAQPYPAATSRLGVHVDGFVEGGDAVARREVQKFTARHAENLPVLLAFDLSGRISM